MASRRRTGCCALGEGHRRSAGDLPPLDGRRRGSRKPNFGPSRNRLAHEPVGLWGMQSRAPSKARLPAMSKGHAQCPVVGVQPIRHFMPDKREKIADRLPRSLRKAGSRALHGAPPSQSARRALEG